MSDPTLQRRLAYIRGRLAAKDRTTIEVSNFADELLGMVAEQQELLNQLQTETVPNLTQRASTLKDLVKDLADPDPCHFDHHGYCQAHGWFDTDPACADGRAQALFPEIKEH
jgi:hypothetical protein